MVYVVKANISGRRICSNPYTSKSEAQAYANSTNKHRKGANARVKKV